MLRSIPRDDRRSLRQERRLACKVSGRSTTCWDEAKFSTTAIYRPSVIDLRR